jgi:hypothetical protein
MRTFHLAAASISLALAVQVSPARLSAQDEPPLPPITATGLSRTLAAIVSTPLGALTPVGPVMATSRDDPFLFGFRLQYGSHALPAGRSLTSYALTTNAQINGGALISATVGHQRGDGDICIERSCDADRWMAGLRYSTSIVTTRPFIELPFFNKNDATGTAALEFGAGWANKGFDEKPHWTADITDARDSVGHDRAPLEPRAALHDGRRHHRPGDRSARWRVGTGPDRGVSARVQSVR